MDAQPRRAAESKHHDQQAECLCLVSPHSDLLGRVDKMSPRRASSSVTNRRLIPGISRKIYSDICVKIL